MSYGRLIAAFLMPDTNCSTTSWYHRRMQLQAPNFRNQVFDSHAGSCGALELLLVEAALRDYCHWL